MTKLAKPYLVNPDFASKMIHYLPNTDGRCHIDKISNPLTDDDVMNRWGDISDDLRGDTGDTWENKKCR